MPPKKGKRPAHQNKKAFHANPHSVKTAKIQALPNEGLCQKCHDIIEWKKKYHKFKPLTAPRRCEICGEKTVVHAYHIVCTDCARSKGICAKCREERAIVKPVVTEEERRLQKEELQLQLMGMNLREKRTFYRTLDRENPELLSELFSDEEDDCCCGDCSKGGKGKDKCSCGHDHCHGHDDHDHNHNHDHDHEDEGGEEHHYHGDDEHEDESDDDLDIDIGDDSEEDEEGEDQDEDDEEGEGDEDDEDEDEE